MATATLLNQKSTGWEAPLNPGTPLIPVVSDSITPGVGCDLICMLSSVCPGTDQFTVLPVSSGSGPTWTLVGKGVLPASGVYLANSGVWRAHIGSTDPGTFTVTATINNASGLFSDAVYLLSIWKVIDASATTPVKGYGINIGVNGAPPTGNGGGTGAALSPQTLTLSATPGATDITLVQCLCDEDDIAMGFVSVFNSATSTYTGVTNSAAIAKRIAWNSGQRTGSTSPTVAWTDVDTGPNSYSSTQVGVVIADGAGAPSGLTPVPTSVSGRKVLDQDGAVWLDPNLSSWGMAQLLTNAQITAEMPKIRARGFKSIVVWCGGSDLPSGGSGWHQYQNAAGQNFWSGTPWQSGLGGAWASVDHMVAEAAANNLFVWISFCSGNTTTGTPGVDWAASTNALMHQVGVDLANRYASARNVGWHIMFDNPQSPTGTQGQRINALFDGINDTEGASKRPVRWIEPNNGVTTADVSWYDPTGATTDVRVSINCVYSYGSSSVEQFEGTYAQTSGATGDCEPPYVGSSYYSGNAQQQYRERNYGTFIEGGQVLNFGHEDYWHFMAAGVFGGGSWTVALDSIEVIQASYAWGLIEYAATADWAPSSTFVTTGVGSGDTKAAVGANSVRAIAYFPTNRTVVVDTTIIAGTAPISIRWYDPVLGSYTMVTAEEAQTASRTVTYPANHADGSSDYLLVVGPLIEPAPLYIGTNPISDVRLGGASVSRLYLGSTQFWPEAPPAPTFPFAPVLTVATPGDTQVTLTWTAPGTGGAAITDYVIEKSPNGTTSWTPAEATTSVATTQIVTGLTNGTIQFFRVSAVNSVGSGPASNVLSATPLPPPTVPGAPTAVSGTASGTQVALTWTAPASNGGSAITGYSVQYAVSPPGTSWSGGTATGSTATNYAVTGLTAGTGYVFRVAAINAVGTGAYSTASSTYTPPGGSFAPSDISGLTFWFDASDASTLTGSPTLTQWRDKSGASRHLTMGGNPQTGTVSLNGLNTIAFDGSGDNGMRSGGGKFFTGTAVTAVAVVRYNGSGYDTKRVVAMSGDGEFDWNSAKGGILIGHESFDYPAANRQGTKSKYSGVLNTWAVVTSVFDGTNHTMYVGSTGYTAAASTGTFSTDIFVLGGNGAYGNSDNANCNIAEVCVYNKALNSTERGNILSYLNTKWAL